MKIPKNKKGQASLEYMVMLALSLGIFAAILYVTNSMITSSNTQIGADATSRAVEGIREAADFIYTHGHPSKTQINIMIPSNIENISIQNNIVRMGVSSGLSYTDIYRVTKGNMTGDISSICPAGGCHEGYYVLDVKSIDPAAGSYDINITVV